MAREVRFSQLVWLALDLAILASCQMNPSGSIPQAVQVAGARKPSPPFWASLWTCKEHP